MPIDYPTLVQIAADEMDADVCSLYIREGEGLVLVATFGLEPEAVGTVAMDLNEGLSGLVYSEARFLSVTEPRTHPRYRHFPISGEEAFRSYLGLPLLKGLGVLVFQTRSLHVFSMPEIKAAMTWAERFSNHWLQEHAPSVPQAGKADFPMRPTSR